MDGLNQNAAIQAAMARRGMGMGKAPQTTPSLTEGGAGQPPADMPSEQANPQMAARPMPPNPQADEAKIILNALAQHLKFLEKSGGA